MRAFTTSLCLPFAALLVACSSYEAAPLQPAATLETLRAETIELPTDGLTATQAVALALVHNPELRAARREHDIAAALVVSQSAWADPELRVSLDDLYSRVRQPFAYAIDLRFFPPLPAELEAKEARALARERRVLARIEQREADFSAATRDAVLRLAHLDAESVLTTEALALHARTEAIVQRRIAAGVTTRADETLVLLRREELTESLAAIESARAVSRAELAALLGAAPGAALRVRPLALDAPYELQGQSDLEELALRSRADLRAAAARYAEREEQLRLRHLARVPWPRHVQGGYSGLPTDTGFDVDLALELPVLGSAEAQIAVAEARRDQAREAYVARLHRVRGEIRLALLGLAEEDRRRRRLDERLAPILAQAEEFVASALEAGTTNVLAVVAIETRILAARRAATDATHAFERARVRLAAATGTVHSLDADRSTVTAAAVAGGNSAQ